MKNPESSLPPMSQEQGKEVSADGWESLLPITLVSTWVSLSYTKAEWAVPSIWLWRKFRVSLLARKPSYFPELGDLYLPNNYYPHYRVLYAVSYPSHQSL